MEQEKPQITIKEIARYVIIGVIVIIILAFVFRFGATVSESNRTDFDKDEVIDSEGYNRGQLEYQRRYLARSGSTCDIRGRYQDGEKANIHIVAERGWNQVDIVNMRYYDDYVNLKLMDNGIFLWQNSANPKYGYFYKTGSPSYARTLEYLSFDDLDIEKTKYECEDRETFVHYIALPNIEWE